MPAVAEIATPKVNLTLRILGRRADGYHELESIVAFARDIGDEIVFSPSAGSPSVTVTGPFASAITVPNLVSVTLDLIARAAPQALLGSVVLTKRLPIAAGIGGGSADAAAVLRAVRTANPDHAAHVDWLSIAARLGADVPVCFELGSKIMRGIGERLEPLPNLPELAAVLVNPMAPVPADKTAQVFRRLGAAPIPAHGGRATPIPPLADRAALLEVMGQVGNDLLAAACEVVPDIEGIVRALSSTPGCELVRLSGGGPTCFGVYPDGTTARQAARSLAAAHPEWWVTPTRLA